MNMARPPPLQVPQTPPCPPLRATLLHQVSTVNAVDATWKKKKKPSELQKYIIVFRTTDENGEQCPLHFAPPAARKAWIPPARSRGCFATAVRPPGVKWWRVPLPLCSSLLLAEAAYGVLEGGVEGVVVEGVVVVGSGWPRPTPPRPGGCRTCGGCEPFGAGPTVVVVAAGNST